MTEPTDKQLEDFAVEEQFLLFCDADEFTQIARAVLAKWGTPPAVAGEPFAWCVTGCSRLLDEDEAKAEARHIGGTARAIPLYTAPQADSVLEDAARYRYLRDGDWREHEELESVIRLQLNTLWDAKIDAARAAQEPVHGDDTARKEGGAA